MTLVVAQGVVLILVSAVLATQIGVVRTAGFFAFGYLLSVPYSPIGTDGSLWKYTLAWPVTVLVLCLVARRPVAIQLTAIIALVGISALADARSQVAFLVASGFVVAYRTTRDSPRPGLDRTRWIVAALLVTVSVFTLIPIAIGSGLFGEAARQRQQSSEIVSAEDPLQAGRPEYGAFLSLLQKDPLGFGPGVTPSKSDVQTGTTGITAANPTVSQAYLRSYLFDNRIELHSLYGDMWAMFGWLGLIYVAQMAAVLLRAAIALPSFPIVVRCLMTYLVAHGLWDTFFSPFQSNFLTTCFVVGIGIALGRRAVHRELIN